jgi:two-component system OmpR family response regulator
MRVLIVEDDVTMVGTLKRALEEDGHVVDTVNDGPKGEVMASDGAYDVIVLDWMMPTKSGPDVVRDLRKQGVSTPVLFVSTLSDVDHKIEGLNAGSNDYLGKPFHIAEFLARVRALWHGRDKVGPLTRLKVSDMEMDLLARTVHRGGKKIDLQPREFRLLEYLMRNAGQVVTRTMLLEKVWDYHFDPQTNVIDVHISRLRAKIDRDFPGQLLHTVRGSGYRLASGGG